MPILDIPGIVRLSVKLDYGRYQQFMTVVYQLLHKENLSSKQSDVNNRIVAAAIERTVQDLMEAAIVSSNPDSLIELLEENARVAHKDLSTKLMIF